MAKLITVAETSTYLEFAEKHLSESERDSIVEALSQNPSMGDIIPGTGGVRKVRFAAKGHGKSGGVRVITFFHNEKLPVYLLTGFAKNERANISDAEKRVLRQITTQLKKIARDK